MDGGGADAGADIYRLPEECVAYAISMTTPGDACHSSAVSPAFKAAADSDAVWARFLPPDCAAILARADDEHAVVLDSCESKKELFTRLCDSPVLLDGATMSFGLERRSGAKCFMLSARALTIGWGDDPACWVWTASQLPGSRFPEVAEIVDLEWPLEISGRLQLSLLTPGTTYAAYLVYAMAEDSYGLECHMLCTPPKATLTVVSGIGSKTTSTEHNVCLRHMQGEHLRDQQFTRFGKVGYDGRPMTVTWKADHDIRCPRRRGDDDGWAEVELGVFAVAGDEDDEGVVEVSLSTEAELGWTFAVDGVVEVSISSREINNGRWKKGLIVQGIEIRPKHNS